jgi:NAD(P)-dependent dehydrogenase (short-subunit alcohol dehydrogenase family)
MAIDASELLYPELLDGLRVAVVGEGVYGQAVRETGRHLGADVCVLALAEEKLDMLVVDGAALFAPHGLHGCLAGAWDVTHAVVNGAFLPGGRGGRIVFLAPPPSAGSQSGAARAGLENLGRTLSIEWARHGITVVTIAPGDMTPAGEVAALCAYLASPAGAYFSGCQLDLRGP